MSFRSYWENFCGIDFGNEGISMPALCDRPKVITFIENHFEGQDKEDILDCIANPEEDEADWIESLVRYYADDAGGEIYLGMLSDVLSKESGYNIRAVHDSDDYAALGIFPYSFLPWNKQNAMSSANWNLTKEELEKLLFKYLNELFDEKIIETLKFNETIELHFWG